MQKTINYTLLVGCFQSIFKRPPLLDYIMVYMILFWHSNCIKKPSMECKIDKRELSTDVSKYLDNPSHDEDLLELINRCLSAKDVELTGILLRMVPKNFKLKLWPRHFLPESLNVLEEVFIKYGIPEGISGNFKKLNQLILTVHNTNANARTLFYLLYQAAVASDFNEFPIEVLDCILTKIIRLYSYNSDEQYIHSYLKNSTWRKELMSPSATHTLFKEREVIEDNEKRPTGPNVAPEL